MKPSLSGKGQALLDILVAHLRKPGVQAQRPETLISYGEALELLHLSPDSPRGPTDGKTLQLNGLNDLAHWVHRQPAMPRITGVILPPPKPNGFPYTPLSRQPPAFG